MFPTDAHIATEIPTAERAGPMAKRRAHALANYLKVDYLLERMTIDARRLVDQPQRP